MHNGIYRVRNAIKERKKRKINESNRKRENSLPYMMTDEEKYGLYSLPAYDLDVNNRPARSFRVYPTAFKLFLSCLLFIVSSIMLKVNIPDNLAPLKKVVYDMYEVEFPFAKVYDWYVTSFGAPFGFEEPLEQTEVKRASLPIGGHVVETFATNGKGILISPEKQERVLAVNRGIVIFCGNDRDTNKTVIIQHPDGTNSTYAHLTTIDVHLYENVNESSQIGTFHPTEENELFYFAIEKDREYVNPAKVIPVDDVR